MVRNYLKILQLYEVTLSSKLARRRLYAKKSKILEIERDHLIWLI